MALNYEEKSLKNEPVEDVKEYKNMKFKALFMAEAPDANKEEDKAVIETGKYKLFVNLVRGKEEALEVAQKYKEEHSIHSVLLCPGFTHEDVGEISKKLGDDVGVTVARGDGPSGQIAKEAMGKAGWFS
ncbi:MAG: DUF6506 family protein [Candidatus Thermoplasmatota archaeon]